VPDARHVRRRHTAITRAGLLAFLGALIPGTGGCSPPDVPRQVIARVGGVPDTQTVPALPTRRVRIAGVTRHAVVVPPDAGFTVPLAAGATHLDFSVGAPDTGPTGASFEIEVALENDEGRVPIYSDRTTDGAVWSDHTVDLRAIPAEGLRVRFGSRSAPETELPGVAWASIRFSAPAPEPHTNVVLVSLDTLSARYLGSQGHPAAASPQLDMLFERSFAFRHAFAQFGNTLVSHSSLFSGLYPLQHGRYGGEGSLPPLASLVQQLASAGHRTVAFTEDVYVGSDFGFARAFDVYDDGPSKGGKAMYGNAEGTFAKALAWLESEGDAGPFFLFVHTYQVHSPYLLADETSRALANALTPDDLREFPKHESSLMVRRHNQGKQPLSRRDVDRLKALHLGEIHYLDRLFGALVRSIEALPLPERTLLVVTADHGDQFGELGAMGHGKSLHESVLHVPLAFYWPGRIEPGSSDAVVQLVDVMPTILELAGASVPEDLDGRSLGPLLTSGAALEARPAYSEMRRRPQGCTSAGCTLERYSVRDEALKLVRRADGTPLRLVQPESDPAEARDLSTERPQELRRLNALLDVYQALGPSVRVDTDATAEGIEDPDLHERLRALGYAD